MANKTLAQIILSGILTAKEV